MSELTYVQQTTTGSPSTDIRSTTGRDYLAVDWHAQGIFSTNRRPVIVKWRAGDLYMAGCYTRPLVRHTLDGKWWAAGIKPPIQPVTVVPGSGSGGSSGACLAFITFLHKAGRIVLAESDWSNVVDVGTLTGQGRAWSTIQNTGADPRVTHVRGYVSMIGGDYKMAWEAPYGISSIEENVPTARLSLLGPDEYGLPPFGTRYIHAWQGRMWYANTPEHPYRIWFSHPGAPQYVRPAAFRDTHEREEITGVWKGRNELIVFCLRSCYLIRQFGSGEDDFVMEKLDSDVGCINHHSIYELHNKLWFAGEDGAWLYDGTFRYLMSDIRLLWQADYAANKDAFTEGFVGHDKINKCFVFFTKRPARGAFENTGLSPGTIRYVGYYADFEPSMGGRMTQPEWSLDMLTRFDSAALYNQDGQLMIASCDGKIRVQDDTDPDDDGDTLKKRLIIRTPHYLFYKPGDSRQNGKTLKQLWTYVESELNSWTLYVLGGDENAWKRVRPDNVRHHWRYVVPASALTQNVTYDSAVYQYEYTEESVHFFLPEKSSGRGFTFEIVADNPVGMQYRGLGGLYSPGPAPRFPKTETLVP